MLPFKPNGDTVTLAATTTSASNSTLPAFSSQVRVYVKGSDVRLRFGAGSLTADASIDMPIAGGNTEVFTKNGATSVAVICESGTATVYVTPGEGE